MAAFTPGNIVVYRVGAVGGGALGNGATAVFLDEYTPAGVLVQSIAMPTADGTGGVNNQMLTAVGNATTEGMLTLSVDGRYLVLAGYDAALGTLNLAATTSAATPRVIGRVAADGTFDTTTTLTNAFSASNPRGVASIDGSEFWVIGGNTGVVHATLGASTGNVVSSTALNYRSVSIFDGQLYVGGAAGTIRMGAVGSGVPATGPQTTTGLAGFPTATTQVNGFVFADLTAAVAGVDTLYVADDRASGSGGGLLKYSLVGGTWVLNGTAAGSLHGLTGSTSGTTVSLYATTANGASVVSLIDTGGYNAAFSTTTLTTIATASTNTAFRGVALAPVASTAGELSIADNSITEGNSGTTQLSFTVTRANGSTGAVGATWTITFSGSADASDLGASQSLTGTVNFLAGETSKTILVDINGDLTVEPNETFNVTLSAPSGGATLGDAAAVGTINNDDVAPGAGTLSIADNSVTEGNSGTVNLSFTVTRSGGSAGAGEATWTITFEAGDSANAADLAAAQALTGTVSFADGETSKTIDIAIAGDLEIEPSETFTITLSAPTGGLTLTDAVATGTIVTDDFTPVPGTLSINDVSVNEGNEGSRNATFTVTRSGGDDGAVSATWTLGFGTADAVDFANGQAMTGTVNFADGETSKTITIAIAGDTVIEANETYTVTLSAPTGGASLGDSSGAGTIVNNDVNVFINEIHYDDAGTDAGEAIEIAAAAGTDLAGWSLVLYNFTGGAQYSTIPLSGIVPNQDDGYGTLSFAAVGLQNGPNDGIALVAPGGIVVQFLSYEGTLTATNGVAAGMTSTDIGVSEEPAPADGLSMQLIGTGSSYADFHWAQAAAFTFGAVNTNQDFLGTATVGQIRVDDPKVVEGNSGTNQLIFTVSRSGGLGGSGTVDYTIALGTADASDIAPGAVFSGTVSFAPGEYSKQVAIGIQGDLSGEPNETLSITLSNPTGSVAIADANGTGTITNDDPIPLAIHDIQGAGHSSPVVGQPVITSGIVTAVDSNGYYIQDPNPDANDATSEGIFVFTSTAPTGVAVGHLVTVTGTVSEFVAAAGALSVTEIVQSSPPVVNSTGNDLPAATIIGAGGRLPPTAVIDDDGLTSFNPATDGIDFYESLEGMRVTISAPKVVANTNGFGETWVVADGGVGATGMSARGGITISAGDFNPERIQIDDDSTIFAGYTPGHSQGDILSNVTGIVNYSQSSYEVLVTQAVTTTTDVTLGTEITTLEGDSSHLAIATFNLENISASDAQEKFDLLAGNIVFNLSAPDIIAVQEIQDADGAGNDPDLSGAATAAKLIATIDALGGPHYVYIEIAPTTAGSTGGEQGGNIRNGYLYNPDRVSFVAGSMELVPGSAFNGTRSPLAADFTFNGTTITLINVHFTSRIGSDPLYGSSQPPLDAGDGARTAQAQAIRDYIEDHLADNPNLHFGVLGDFNGFYFENAVGALTAGGVMTDLHTLLPAEERYSYLFDGNLQAIDHILFTGGLMPNAQYDPVHINAERSGSPRGTDHDPQLALLFIPVPNTAPALDLDGDDSAADGTGFASSYSEGGAAAPIADSDVAITDGNTEDDIVSATITITDPEAGDKLNVGTLPNGVTVDPSSTDTIVKLVAAPGTSADAFETAIQAVTYSNTGDNPTGNGTNTERTVTVVVNDGEADSNVATTTITITAVNDEPTGTSSTVSTPEDTARTFGTGDFGFGDVDTGDTMSAVVITAVSGGRIFFDSDGAGGADPVEVTTFPATYTATEIGDGKLSFVPNLNLNGTGAGSVSFKVVDSSGAGNNTDSSANTLTIDISAVNDQPNIPNSPTIGATEQVPVVINAALAVSDADLDARNGGNGDYAGASFAINRDVSNAEDLFSFASGGSFTISGNNLQSGGLTFATFSQSAGILNITFTSSGTPATTALVNDVLQHIQYTNTSDTPPASVTLIYVIDDGAPGGGQGSVTAFNNIDGGQVMINITPTSEAPLLDLNGAGAGTSETLAYFENQTAKKITPAATVSDLDQANFNGGVLTLTFTANGTADDRLVVIDQGFGQGKYTVDNNNIYYDFGTGVDQNGDPVLDPRLIGTFSGGTSGSAPLTINLTSDATIAITQGLLRTIGYFNVSDTPVQGSRTVTYTLSDGTGNVSNSAIATINVTALSDQAVAEDDNFTTDDNVPVSGNVFDANSNGQDYDPEGGALAVTAVNGSEAAVNNEITLGSGAKLRVNDDGSFTYNPNGAFNSLVPIESGAVNYFGFDTFTYTLNGGDTATVFIGLNGVISPGDIYKGDSDDNVIFGTSEPNFFLVNQGGNDTLIGRGGNDVFLFGATLTGADNVDGRRGVDQIAIQGDYSGGVTLGAGIILVESLAILPGSDTRFGDPGTNLYDYVLTTVDENVAAGATMVVDANRLQVGEDLTFNGSAETDGSFFIYGGRGVDTLTGGAKNDVFYFGEGGQWGSGDTVNGGPGGTDQLALRGDYTIVFGATQLIGIESIGMVSALDTRFGALGSRYDYNLTMNDGNVLAGQRMTVDAAPLASDETLVFNGSAETNGSFRVFGGAGADVISGSQNGDLLYGGLGADTLTGGGGNDIFVYRSVAESTSVGRDAIQDFTAGDKIDLSAIDAIAGNGTNDAFTYIGANAFSHTAGELRATDQGGIWTVQGDVNGDGVSDFELIVVLTGGHPLPLGGSDFVL